MPYITHEAAQELLGRLPETPGELTYCFYMVAVYYLESQADEIRYADLNDVRGAMIGAWQEFERTIVAPYEDKKRAENPIFAAERLVRRVSCD